MRRILLLMSSALLGQNISVNGFIVSRAPVSYFTDRDIFDGSGFTRKLQTITEIPSFSVTDINSSLSFIAKFYFQDIDSENYSWLMAVTEELVSMQDFIIESIIPLFKKYCKTDEKHCDSRGILKDTPTSFLNQIKRIKQTFQSNLLSEESFTTIIKYDLIFNLIADKLADEIVDLDQSNLSEFELENKNKLIQRITKRKYEIMDIFSVLLIQFCSNEQSCNVDKLISELSDESLINLTYILLDITQLNQIDNIEQPTDTQEDTINQYLTQNKRILNVATDLTNVQSIEKALDSSFNRSLPKNKSLSNIKTKTENSLEITQVESDEKNIEANYNNEITINVNKIEANDNEILDKPHVRRMQGLLDDLTKLVTTTTTKSAIINTITTTKAAAVINTTITTKISNLISETTTTTKSATLINNIVNVVPTIIPTIIQNVDNVLQTSTTTKAATQNVITTTTKANLVNNIINIIPTRPPTLVDDVVSIIPTVPPTLVDDVVSIIPTLPPTLVDDVVSIIPTVPPTLVDDVVSIIPTVPPTLVDDVVSIIPTVPPTLVDDVVSIIPTLPPSATSPVTTSTRGSVGFLNQLFDFLHHRTNNIIATPSVSNNLLNVPPSTTTKSATFLNNLSSIFTIPTTTTVSGVNIAITSSTTIPSLFDILNPFRFVTTTTIASSVVSSTTKPAGFLNNILSTRPTTNPPRLSITAQQPSLSSLLPKVECDNILCKFLNFFASPFTLSSDEKPLQNLGKSENSNSTSQFHDLTIVPSETGTYDGGPVSLKTETSNSKNNESVN